MEKPKQGNGVVYILACDGDCFYVDWTDGGVMDAFEAHVKGKDVTWTKHHKPYMIHDAFEGTRAAAVLCTLLYMKVRGIDKVRGALWRSTAMPLTVQRRFEQYLSLKPRERTQTLEVPMRVPSTATPRLDAQTNARVLEPFIL
ncbi:Hypothetical protein POVN_LOCUS213 [uncultured virus]|nr:Hypothetical protein POVN_LOCUS213 [uncultured virus]